MGFLDVTEIMKYLVDQLDSTSELSSEYVSNLGSSFLTTPSARVVGKMKTYSELSLTNNTDPILTKQGSPTKMGS